MQAKYLIGTLFEEQQLNKKININNVKAKDPMGNVRWKGAFTGGFEAGYKNTCGSRQGWAPSTFVSSVGSRVERKQQNIFDFMDKEDFGRGDIGQNISTNQSFTRSDSNPLSISIAPSAGQKILSSMKKHSAYQQAPQNLTQLANLLQNYQNEQKLYQQNRNYSYNLKGTEGYASVGATNIPDDDFIVAYEDLFRKVIRAGIKEESQEEIKKRREENKVYFDFTRPLEKEPQYLKQIHEVQESSKPKKRRRNVINDKNLKNLFKIGSSSLCNQQTKKFIQIAPQGYDPYHRLKNLKQSQKQFINDINQKKKHRIHSVNQRSDMLNQVKLSNRFVSSTANVSSNKFVKTGQQQAAKDLQKVFDDIKKNQRYWDYVLQLEGKKISAQLQYMSYEQAQKQKQEFQKVYMLKQIGNKNKEVNNEKPLPQKIQQAIQNRNRKQVKIQRRTGFWKPQKLLCKRFGCVLPYKEQNKNSKSLYN